MVGDFDIPLPDSSTYHPPTPHYHHGRRCHENALCGISPGQVQSMSRHDVLPRSLQEEGVLEV